MANTTDLMPVRRYSGLLSDTIVLKAITHIEADYSAPLTLDSIAEATGLSPFHFHRRFGKVMRETVAEHVRRVRMEHAAVHVCRTRSSLIGIALRFGYGSQEAFTRTYVQRFGMTPGRMRKMSQKTLRQPNQRDLDWAGLVRPKELATLPLVGIRFIGKPDDAGAHWREFATILQTAGFSLNRARAVGIRYDDPDVVPVDARRFDCCVVVDDGLPAHLPPPPLRRLWTRPGLYGVLTRLGGPDVMAEAISSVVLGWIPSSRHALGDTLAYEFHHDPPWQGEPKRATVFVPLV